MFIMGHSVGLTIEAPSYCQVLSVRVYCVFRRMGFLMCPGFGVFEEFTRYVYGEYEFEIYPMANIILLMLVIV